MELTPIKAYSKSELCLLYECSDRTFSKWIEKNTLCKEMLEILGYQKSDMLLTPKMVEIIFESLGNPRNELHKSISK
jgi:hypothetical protein